MITATMFEAKTRLSELVKQVQAGETVIITSGRERTPVAKLEPIMPVTTMRLGALQHLGFVIPESFADPLPDEELRLWEQGDEDDPLYTGKPR